ncbi:putative transposase, Ptta/En/Spm, plant [Medicago truncatula]|uniref:Putative transposase, Ptta/En/Spm, plant n=1 Tax=Medicago truncatula TaxID=3880 RepID=A0A396I0R2_MEDTR|nr:putative transposase, Ptta/En/Spm, plant [Medicago truncatula]
MPLKNKGNGKGNNRKRYNTHVVDAATEARLNPMPVTSAASSSQGSAGSSQASVAAPPTSSALPPTYMLPPVYPGYYGTIPPSYHFPPYSVPPQNLPFPQQQQISPQQNNLLFPQQQQIPPQQNPLFPQQQIPPQQNPPFPQQQQNPPQPQQENVVEEDGATQMNGGRELVPYHDVFPDYPKDSLGRYILRPSGSSFLPCKPAAEAIRDIIHNCYHHFWKKYGDVDDNEKDRWFRLFECKCSWDAVYQDIMRRNFHIRASARFSDLLRRARIRFEETGKRPHWIGSPIFADLVKYWASDEFKKISQKAKTNRASEKGGCIHTGGCLSNGEHADRLEEYDRLLAEAISEGSTVDHSLTFRTWKKVVGDKKKGKLYGLGNLAANCRPGSVESTLTFTLNHGEGSSRQPELTPEMRELINRLAQEQFAQQMATQAAVVQDLLNRQRSYEEQLAQFRQAQAQDPSPILSPNVEPYPVDRDEEEDGVDNDDDD